MLILPALFALLVFVFIRPQEIWPALEVVKLTWVLALAMLGYFLDLGTRHARIRLSPVLVSSAAFFGFCVFSLFFRGEGEKDELIQLTASFLVTFFIGSGLQSLRALRAVMMCVAVLTMFITSVGVHQRLQPQQCMAIPENSREMLGGVSDGRHCEDVAECATEDPGPGSEWGCERPGLLGTSTIKGRVRYRGILQDPNETAWAVAMAVPVVLVLVLTRMTLARLSLAAFVVLAAGLCVVGTKSRSGLLALVAGLGVFVIRRVGWKGILVAGVMAAPLLLLGGRSGGEASASSRERLECLAEGLAMWRYNPVFGVGMANFTEHHYLTAHNSVVLTLAELGPIGLFLWSSTAYFAVKTVLAVERSVRGDPEAREVHLWSVGLIASFVALLASALFLSIAYHQVLWTYVGLVSALFVTVKRHRPDLRIPVRLRDLLLIATADALLVTGTYLFIRLRGFG